MYYNCPHVGWEILGMRIKTPFILLGGSDPRKIANQFVIWPMEMHICRIMYVKLNIVWFKLESKYT